MLRNVKNGKINPILIYPLSRLFAIKYFDHVKSVAVVTSILARQIATAVKLPPLASMHSYQYLAV